MPIYRIRKHCGSKGWHNHYFHADVVARSPASAMKAARENRIRNWRHIDKFDMAPETYEWFEFLYRIDNESEARRPRAPLTDDELGLESRRIERLKRNKRRQAA